MFSATLSSVPSSQVDESVLEALAALSAAWSKNATRTDGVVSAARFALGAHAGQFRLSGELYASHPLQVAAIVASWGFDEVSVLAACCHDVLEDCGVSVEELESAIGPEAAKVVNGVTKVGSLHLGSEPSTESASMTKFLAAVVDDVRVLAVKLADRLHNLRTAGHLPKERAVRTAREALEVFAPLAHRLGLDEPRREMEDLAFSLVHPDEYLRISEELESTAASRHEVESEVSRAVVRLLANAELRGEVESRTKHLYSVWSKQAATGVPVAQMHDLVGIRIILPDRDSCYSALGVIHAAMTPVPGRFKDYIALPRPSGYRSLHTTVLADGVEVEVQIRSEEMHVQARYGVAAHYLYKKSNAGDRRTRSTSRPGTGPISTRDEEMAAALASSGSPEDFLEKLRRDLAPAEEVVVLTPRGRPVVLPASATVLDFAYKIHTDVGHRCTGAKINGVLVPIRSALRTGDVVEVLTGPTPAPKHDWLSIVATARAREKIRKFLDDASVDPVSEGRSHLLDELRSRSASHRAEDDLFLARLASGNGFNSTTDMLRSIGSGSRPVSTLLGLPSRPSVRRTKKSPEASTFTLALTEVLGGLPYSMPRCCTARNLEHSTGIVSRLHEVSVHESSCASLAATVRDLPPGDIFRLIPLVQDSSVGWLEIHAANRSGLLRDVSAVLAAADIAWSSSSVQDLAVLRFRFASRIPDRGSVLERLFDVDGVQEVYAV